MRNKVIVEVDGYRGGDFDGKDAITLKIESHWNYDTIVHINIDEKQYTFMARDLIDAIQRCS